jgi:anaphase-promoting complex subunit 6
MLVNFFFFVVNVIFVVVIFSKSTTADPFFAPGWLGFGHTFSAQDESDQAMIAYRTAARLFEGSYMPLLCIGVEYARTNNLILAEQFFIQVKRTKKKN